MSELADLNGLLGGDFSYRLVFTLLHFVWQAAIVGAIAYCITLVLRQNRDRNAYGINVACLASLVFVAIVTFALVQPPQKTTPLVLAPIHGNVTVSDDVSMIGGQTPAPVRQQAQPFQPAAPTSFDFHAALSQLGPTTDACLEKRPSRSRRSIATRHRAGRCKHDK